MVRAGGSASRTINNSDTPDAGGGHHPAWKRPKDDAHGPRWIPDTHGFPVLIAAIPDTASVVLEQNSNLDPLGCPERDGSHQAPLGRKVRAPRRRMRPLEGRVTTERGNDAK